jgi:hypothetical protein
MWSKCPRVCNHTAVDKVTVLLGVSVDHAKNAIRWESHLYNLSRLFTPECIILSASTALSKERLDSQTSHWTAQVVSKELCIAISISTLHSHAGMQTRAVYTIHTQPTKYYPDSRISVPRISCNISMKIHEVVEIRGLSTECDRRSNSLWTRPFSRKHHDF